MKDFFKKFFYKGLMIIFILIIIWVIYFIINFIDPTLFNFLRAKNINQEASSTAQSSQTFGYKIYNMFFKSKATSKEEIHSSEVAIPKKNDRIPFEGGENVVWGENRENSLNDLEGMIFIYPNTTKSPIRGMKINSLLVNENNFNYIPNRALITGSVYTGFLNDYYFSAEIYDINGKFLFSLPITSNHDFNKESFSNFFGEYNNNLNYSNYKGKAYLVIKSNNQNVSGSILVKIEIK